MFKRIFFSILCAAFFGANVYSQAVTVTDISSSGHFANATIPSGCAMGLPIVTATFLSGTGTTLSNGVIQCTDPCGFTTVRITLSNVRWSQNPNVNWIHGISFTPGNVTVSVPAFGLPAGWAPFTSSTGSCSAGITTGTGFYYDGTALQNCCPGTTANDGIPGNNYGDQIANCGYDYTFTFDLTFCNSSITNNPLVFSARGTSDYQTGCWTGVDDIGTSRIQFVLSTTPCSVPIFSTVPSATAPAKSCSGSTVNYTSTLTSNCGSGAQVTWWTASTGGTLIGSGSPFVYDPPGSACPAGTTLYAACCPVGSTCVTRRAFAIPGTCAPALTMTNVAITNPSCSSPTGSINAVTVTGASGTVVYTLNPGNLTNTSGIFTGLTGLNYTLTATDDAGCSTSSSVVFIPGGTGGVPPTVTSPVTYCQGQSVGVVPISATAATGGILTYYLPGGGAGLTTPPTPSTTVVGTFTYTVTQTIAGCVSAAVPIVVIITPTPAAPTVTATQSFCQGTTPAPVLTAGGTGLLWYTTATGGTGTATAPTVPTVMAGVLPTYYVASTQGACESPRSSIVVTIIAKPNPPTTTAISYCQGAVAPVLVPVTASGSNLLWYVNAIGGTGNTTAPTPTTTTVGTQTFYVTQTVNGCESNRQSLVVTINATPAAPGANQVINYCVGSAVAPLSAPGTNLLWYTAPTGGTGSSTVPIASSATAGTFNYYVSQTAIGCESPRSEIKVIVTALPPKPTVNSPVPYCQSTTINAVPLTASTNVAGATLLWYLAATGGTSSTTAPTPSITTSGLFPYYVSQITSGTGCEGPREVINVVVTARPSAPTVSSPLAYCQNGNSVPLTGQGSGLLYYTAATGGTGVTTLTPNTSAVGSTTYYVSQTPNTCEGPRAAIVVNINQSLTANAGNTVTISSGDQTLLNGAGTPGARYLWSTLNSAPLALVGGPASATLLQPFANPLQTTTYRLTVSDANTPAVCPSVFSDVVVNVVQSCINVRNAFTPNGDGINDIWLVYDQAFCLRANTTIVNVFNRYGSKVFESKNYSNNWDGTYKGKALPDGTYYGVIEFTLLNGTKKTVKTDITLLR